MPNLWSSPTAGRTTNCYPWLFEAIVLSEWWRLLSVFGCFCAKRFWCLNSNASCREKCLLIQLKGSDLSNLSEWTSERVICCVAWKRCFRCCTSNPQRSAHQSKNSRTGEKAEGVTVSWLSQFLMFCFEPKEKAEWGDLGPGEDYCQFYTNHLLCCNPRCATKIHIMRTEISGFFCFNQNVEPYPESSVSPNDMSSHLEINISLSVPGYFLSDVSQGVIDFTLCLLSAPAMFLRIVHSVSPNHRMMARVALCFFTVTLGSDVFKDPAHAVSPRQQQTRQNENLVHLYGKILQNKKTERIKRDSWGIASDSEQLEWRDFRICQCPECKTYDDDQPTGVCCKNSLSDQTAFEALFAVVGVFIGNETGNWSQVQEFKARVIEALVNECDPEPDRCNLNLVYMREVLAGVDVVSVRTPSKILNCQSGWADVIFSVRVQPSAVKTLSDAQQETAIAGAGQAGKLTGVYLAASVLQIALRNQLEALTSAINVSGAVMQLRDYKKLQYAEEKDLNMTGIVFGGIFASLFVLTCCASAKKAVTWVHTFFLSCGCPQCIFRLICGSAFQERLWPKHQFDYFLSHFCMTLPNTTNLAMSRSLWPLHLVWSPKSQFVVLFSWVYAVCQREIQKVPEFSKTFRRLKPDTGFPTMTVQTRWIIPSSACLQRRQIYSTSN